MSSTEASKSYANPKEERRELFIEALLAFDSNIGGALGNETRWTRFFKVMRRDDGSWLAMLGSKDEEGSPIIYFGNGQTLMKAWQSLGQSMGADEWREDRFA